MKATTVIKRHSTHQPGARAGLSKKKSYYLRVVYVKDNVFRDSETKFVCERLLADTRRKS